MKKEQVAPEIERKYLIAMPELAGLAAAGAVADAITQTYLVAEAGLTRRVRRRVREGRASYTYNEKRRQSDLTAIEREATLSEAEYRALLEEADPARRPIEKTRWCLPYGGHLLEIDIYPFWQRTAILEIELTSECETVLLPPFLTLIREVTGERAYRNAMLACAVPPEPLG